MTGIYKRRRLAGIVIIAFAAGAFAATSLLGGMASADDPGKPRGRSNPEPLATLTSRERSEMFRPGKAWDGTGRGGLNERQISDFRDYPLFWLGDAFAGFNLQTVRHLKYDAPLGAMAQDRVTFIYGECLPAAGANRCPVPAQIHVQPVCAVLPEEVAEDAKQGALQTLAGGARLQRFADGHIMVWTDGVVLDVTTVAQPSLVNRALAELRGVGRNQHELGQTLPAPDFRSC
jgi:hypothetical protein